MGNVRLYRQPGVVKYASPLLTNIADRDWVADAACVGANPELFDVHWTEQPDADGAKMPESPGERDGVNLIAIHDYCAICPVAQQCLDDALGDPRRNGVYGGYQIWAEQPRWR